MTLSISSDIIRTMHTFSVFFLFPGGGVPSVCADCAVGTRTAGGLPDKPCSAPQINTMLRHRRASEKRKRVSAATDLARHGRRNGNPRRWEEKGPGAESRKERGERDDGFYDLKSTHEHKAPWPHLM